MKSVVLRQTLIASLAILLNLCCYTMGAFSPYGIVERRVLAGSNVRSRNSLFIDSPPMQQFVQSIHQRKESTSSSMSTSSSTQLALDFGGLENFFNLNNRLNRKKIDEDSEINDDDSQDEEDYPGCTNIFKIKVKSLKVGGCRLYLSLFFMGEANNPTKGSWRMNQNGDGGIDMYYKDTTGALIIEFREDSIIVKRLGSSPSMEYLMQESSMLNGMLDQLDEIAMDATIDESDRLICIDDDEINAVRESLSFT